MDGQGPIFSRDGDRRAAPYARGGSGSHSRGAAGAALPREAPRAMAPRGLAGEVAPPRARVSAAASHHANDDYMDEFNAALADMGMCDQQAEATTPHGGARGGASQLRVASAGEVRACCPGVPLEARLAGRWARGPLDPAGALLDLSDRNLLCLSVSPVTSSGGATEVAVGGADHAIYTFDLETGRKRRTLHSKRYGHADWVACVGHTASGQVLSGGADGKLCLWASGGGVACEDLSSESGATAHAGPVSVLKCDAGCGLAVSGGYDKTVRLWDVHERSARGGGGGGGSASAGGGRFPALGAAQPRSSARSRGRELPALTGHRAPVTVLAWGPAADSSGGGGEGGGGGGAVALLSGDRDGVLAFWDLAVGRLLRQPVRHGQGHVTCVAAAAVTGSAEAPLMRGASGGAEAVPGGAQGRVFFSGGQDGCVRVHDVRAKQAVACLKLHASKSTGVTHARLRGGGGSERVRLF